MAQDLFAAWAVLQRAEAIDCPVLVTPAVHDMLQQPALKRLAWQTLRLATLGDG